ncbi:hypothetical protein DTO027I6_3028 [Penicillium roqueforti]|uniref:uncharacterized protein n=1 Tax=Penicillium roqueforti TaxID=5082 RepID=UPI00190E593C|nr:uncharacterized protein LCP9604111_108 [Penicillium roqueforti]KAF9252582.1 hypothetical protein LCP9604111_108 [Penicillium roqueforti]KAI1835647.1 hypothetical protein CBS147337_3670 [Penicillium roqueforti]KAI3131553.1 hypothetical protein CBS147326_5516 [Penicillium roqueforti]KAI3167875.1 hypothetical protein DTO039G3_5969 [Penicillium roqueforti]KAI3215424.1 hypothetical protein DTO027I6_3028 [Penicillium roqueforti]
MGFFSTSNRADSFIAAGTTSTIYAVDENFVIKLRPSLGDFQRQAYDTEVRSYKRLGHHGHIASCEVNEEGLLLERGICLRTILQSAGSTSDGPSKARESPISLATKLQWAQEAADGLAYIHSKGIVHADIGCHNMTVDNSNHVKFIDFAGSGIDSEAPLVCYEWFSFQPGKEIGVCTDIFAFGSMLFELETGRVPYSELEGTMEMGNLITVVENLFAQRQFPSVETLALGSVISACWNGKYNSMEEVHRDIACQTMSRRTLRLLGYTTAVTGITGYSIHRGLSHLEEKYPALPPAAGSRALRTPEHPNTQRCAYTDIYAAQIPLQALEARIPSAKTSSKTELEYAWARSVLGSKLLRAEGSILGLLTSFRFTPCDTGSSTGGFSPDETTGAPRVLLNGLFQVQRLPAADADSNGLLVSSELPDKPRVFFEMIARWGYPWRLMSRVKHEMSVSEPFWKNGQGMFVEVRFASAHDYEIVDVEGELGKQKIIPDWTLRLHRGYARLILDSAVRELQRDVEK